MVLGQEQHHSSALAKTEAFGTLEVTDSQAGRWFGAMERVVAEPAVRQAAALVPPHSHTHDIDSAVRNQDTCHKPIPKDPMEARKGLAAPHGPS